MKSEINIPLQKKHTHGTTISELSTSKIMNRYNKSILPFLIIAILWSVLTLYASTMSSSTVKSVSFFHFEGIDKVAHFVLYAIFSFTWSKAFSYIWKKSYIWYAFIFAVVFGIGMELLQFYFFPDRSFEVSDIIANIIGSFVGVSILNRIKLFKLC